MATNKKTVSVYADDDLLTALEEFKDSGNYKSLNVAIVAILREKLFGDTSGNIQSTLQNQVLSTLDIDNIVNKAVESRLDAVLDQVNQFRLDVNSLKTDDLLYQNLRTNLTVAQQRIEALEAIATAKKPLMLSITSNEGGSNAEITGNSVEHETLPIIEAIATIESPIIENPLPDDALSNAIAATDDSTDSIELPVKEVVAGINSHRAFAIAQQRGYEGKVESFRSRFEKQNLGAIYHLRRIPHKRGKENWLYFDTKA